MIVENQRVITTAGVKTNSDGRDFIPISAWAFYLIFRPGQNNAQTADHKMCSVNSTFTMH